jgi:hypothetical protein
MDVSVTMTGPDAADELRSLYAWLTGEDELRGHARLVGASPPPGALGTTADALVVALGPGGVSAAVATALVAWLRQRTGDVVIKARGRGTEVELSAKRVRGLDSAQLGELAQHLARELGEADAGGEGAGPAGPGPL